MTVATSANSEPARPMLSVIEARDLILNAVHPLSAETLSWEAIPYTAGRALAETITANQDLPPFANSSMDGFAVRSADVSSATPENPVTLQVVGEIPAGSAPQFIVMPGTAARIMTGAMLPDGADCIVPVEDTDAHMRREQPTQVQINTAAKVGAYVRPVGEDLHAGQTVLDRGRVLRPADIGVLASTGVMHIQVTRRPRVAVLSTGDELVMPGEALQPGQIRDANAPALCAAIVTLGAIPLPLGIARDTEAAVESALQSALDQGADLILSSAGVSVGAYDVVKTVVERLGALNFWKVNLRPGKPLAFGNVAHVPYLGLPGNPVSSLVTFDLFARPLILKLAGLADRARLITVMTGEAIRSDGRESYLRARLDAAPDQAYPVATLTGTQSSGALSSLVQADVLLIIPAGVTAVEAGSQLQARLLA